MKTTKGSIFIVFFPVVILILAAYFNAVSNPNGISGKTRKTTSAGCGSCHNFGTGITGTIDGPDSVQTGQTAVFTITLNFPGSANGGMDIAAKRGTLAAGPGSAYIKLLNGELTHKNPIAFANTVSVDFSYTAPSTAGSDTLYATIDRNYTGSWNFIENRGIKIFSSIGIIGMETPVCFRLSQNFPNPFNPVTSIYFSIKKPGLVEIRVFDAKGSGISSPVHGRMNSGDYITVIDASSYPSGIYFYRLVFTDENGTVFSETKKMSLVK